MKRLEDIIAEAVLYLEERESARENAFYKSRKARILSKQAILFIHSNDKEEAGLKINDASQIMKEIHEYVNNYPEMEYYEVVQAARQEYAEAVIFYALTNEDDFPTPESIDIPPADYILGLADVPGEIRRQTLDILRDGKLTKAEKNLAIMERIYLSLVQAEEASLLIKGLRHKMDVTRMLNERTRSEISNELSRQKLSKELKILVEKIESRQI
jgi:translin